MDFSTLFEQFSLFFLKIIDLILLLQIFDFFAVLLGDHYFILLQQLIVVSFAEFHVYYFHKMCFHILILSFDHLIHLLFQKMFSVHLCFVLYINLVSFSHLIIPSFENFFVLQSFSMHFFYFVRNHLKMGQIILFFMKDFF